MDGAPILGIISQPVLGERWFGLAGETTTLNGQPIKTRACSTLADAWMYSTDPSMFQGSAERAFKSLSGCVKHALFGNGLYRFWTVGGGLHGHNVRSGYEPLGLHGSHSYCRGRGWRDQRLARRSSYLDVGRNCAGGWGSECIPWQLTLW